MREIMMKTGWSALVALSLLLPLSLFANMGTEGDESVRDANYLEGKKALDKQDWARAIEFLGKAAQTNGRDADTQNGLGYAYRMSGNLDAAFKHYKEALALNPKHRAAHEYIGEAYLKVDQLAKAEEHLAALQLLCAPIPCEEVKDLKRAIDTYRKGKK
jgi:Flp pilus assembly protein TadD